MEVRDERWLGGREREELFRMKLLCRISLYLYVAKEKKEIKIVPSPFNLTVSKLRVIAIWPFILSNRKKLSRSS